MRPEDSCCHPNSSEKPLANAGVKKSQRNYNDNNNGPIISKQEQIRRNKTANVGYVVIDTKL